MGKDTWNAGYVYSGLVKDVTKADIVCCRSDPSAIGMPYNG